MTAVTGAAQAGPVGSDARNQMGTEGVSSGGGIQTFDEEPTGNVTGTVSTQDGYRIADADVRLVNATSGEVERTNVSGSNGGYAFRSVEPGTYRVEAEFGESEATSANATVEEGMTRSRNIEMKLSGAYFSVSVEGTNSPVPEGEEIRVDATVTNAGEESASQAVVVELPGLGSDAEPVSLDGESSETVSLGLPTELGDAGNYTAEVSTNDDAEEVGIIVEARQPGLDVSISGTNSPVTEGETLTVEARISNPGGVSGTGTVTAEVGGTDIGSDRQSFSLSGGEEETKKFRIPTEEGDAGEYTVSVSVGNQYTDSTDVTVEETAETNETANETEAGEGVPENGAAEGADSETEDMNGSVTGGNDSATEDASGSVTEGNDSATEAGDGEKSEAGGGSEGADRSSKEKNPQEDQQFSLREIGTYLGIGAAVVVGFGVFVAFSVFVVRKMRKRNRDRGGSEEGNGGRMMLDTDSENEVYVSWSDMVERAGVEDIRTKTPSEIAESAKEAGLNPEAVDELTDVFEEVRYRDAEPTPEQEERAREALERIDRSDRRE